MIPTPISSKIRIRPANEEDIPMIFNSWLKSYRTSQFAQMIASSIYFSEHHKTIERILKAATVLVACNDEDSSHIYGWICAHQVAGIFTLHYLYVKQPFRRMGLAHLLFNSFEHSEGAGVFTHHTRPMEAISKKYNLVYHPYIYINDYMKEPSDEESSL